MRRLQDLDRALRKSAGTPSSNRPGNSAASTADTPAVPFAADPAGGTALARSTGSLQEASEDGHSRPQVSNRASWKACAMRDDNDEAPRGERPAVAAPPGLLARYQDDPRKPGLTTPIYAFSDEGRPLVLNPGGTLMVRADRPEMAGSQLPYAGIDVQFGPPLAGPFTPAPAGLVAVFDDGRERPVLFYDLHGRAVLMNLDDVACDLVLAETIADLKRVDFRSSPGAPELG